MKFLILLILLISFHVNVAQTTTGIHLTVPCNKNTKKHPILFSIEGKQDAKKTVCITSNAVIPITEFYKVSPLQQFQVSNQKFLYFDVTLSRNGASTLQKIKDSMGASKIALVVEDDVLFVVDISDLQFLQTFRFQSSDPKSQLEPLHHRLEAMIQPQ